MALGGGENSMVFGNAGGLNGWKFGCLNSLLDGLPIKYVDQLNSIDGETDQSLLPQPSVGQFCLIKWAG